MSLNIPLARKVLEHVEAFPDEFDMGNWVCGINPQRQRQGWYCQTSACIAGWALILSNTGKWAQQDGGDMVWVLPAEAEYLGYRDAGQQVLGLTYSQAEVLFYDGERRAKKTLARYIKDAEKAERE